MQVVGIIPARYGSTRFPGKPLALIAGRPLIHWVYEAAQRVPGLTAVSVATDDDRIAAAVRALGGRAVMTGSHHPSGSDRLAEAARLLDLKPEDIVVNIQGDQIVFPIPLIADLVESLKTAPEAAMATAVRPCADPVLAADPNVVKAVFDRQGFALYFSRAAIPYYREQEGEPLFYKNIGIYVYRQAFLKQFVELPPGRWEAAEKLEQLRVLEYGYRIKVVATTGETLEIDTPAEARWVEAYLRGQGSVIPPAL
ncbi:MAG: 3-deoxy-manno-octulosonate cytidylyltransferase [Desulfobacca sp.]|uniref:3-deoxy-manno-octulosonate cytidylyltransferase n=1 Tax=Desulfobacca sp. TaxID=2067990 RepID=UPI00404B71C1